LRDVSVEIRKGELMLVVGPSGSGKTTLLLVCGTLLRPDTGSVVVDGQDTSSLKESSLAEVRLKKIGFVFQQFNLLRGFNALENVEVVLNMNGIRGSKARELALRALEDVGVRNRARHFPEDLSGGESQRVAIARAIANDPKLIIADEPTANLDSKTGLLVSGIVEGHRQKRGEGCPGRKPRHQTGGNGGPHPHS
jgi:putative ABC transport system ATP-binding protein